METEEVYDVLMEKLIAAINGYDPTHKDKIKLVADTIRHELSKRKQFTAAHVGHYLEFDCSKHLRLLCRVGFLQSVPRGEGEAALARTASWPPPAKFFQGDVIGLAYYLQKWFRFHLQDWINRRMRELESKDGVYSLEDWNTTRARFSGEDAVDEGSFLEQVVNADGDYRNTDGTFLSADVGMMRKPLSIPARKPVGSSLAAAKTMAT